MLWVSHSVAGDVFFSVFVFSLEGLKMVFMTFLGTFLVCSALREVFGLAGNTKDQG